MKVRLLYTPGCPALEETRRRLREGMARLGIVEPAEEVAVLDGESAVREGFLGSPSIQVEGADIERARRSNPPAAG